MGILDALNLPTLNGQPARAVPKPSNRVLDRIGDKRQRERKWNETKTAVWARDERTCRLCGRHVVRTMNVQANRGEVHHIRPRSLAKDRFYEMSNLLLTCLECHAKVGAKKIEVKERG